MTSKFLGVALVSIISALLLIVVVSASDVSAAAENKQALLRALGNNKQNLTANGVVHAMASVFCPHFSAAGLAGIIGNAVQESSLNPTISQYGGGPGRGLYQMSVDGLWKVNQEYCAENGCNVWTAEGQSAFVRDTIITSKWAARAYGEGTAAELRRALQGSSVSSTTIAFMQDWERCGDCDSGSRITYANQYYSIARQLCG